MNFTPSTIHRAVRAIVPSGVAQYRCLHAAPISNLPRPSLPKKEDTFPQRRAFHASPTSFASGMKDPYATLGVDKNASTSEIKKAYYAAAKKYHPDSSKEANAREKFQEVQSAYEILSDSEKKAQYDQFGQAGFDPNGGFNGAGGFGGGAGFGGAGGWPGGFSGHGGAGFGADFSFEDLFNSFGGGRARGRGPFGGPSVVTGDNIDIQTTITFMEAAKGTKKTIKYKAQVDCGTCTGTGMKAGTKKKQCGRCGGTGQRVHFMAGGFQMGATCDSCGGSGIVIPPGNQCRSCQGEGVEQQVREVSVDIPAGVDDSMAVSVPGKGHSPASSGLESGTKTRPGDLIVHIRVGQHPKFTRDGANILYTASIPLTTGLLGGIIRVPTLDGDVELRVPTGTNTGDRITMSGKGMKKINSRYGGVGDLRVTFKLNMPKSLTTSQRTLLELLADEFKDSTAKRIMNLNQYKDEGSSSSSSGAQQPQSTDNHDHEGFLTRIWEKLTHGKNSRGNSGSEDKKP